MNDLSLHADSICYNNNDNKNTMVEIKDLSESSRQRSKPRQLLQTPVRLPQALGAKGLDDEEYCNGMNGSCNKSSSSSVNKCAKSEKETPLRTSMSKNVQNDEIPPNNPPLELPTPHNL
jgi:hypothetical protein